MSDTDPKPDTTEPRPTRLWLALSLDHIEALDAIAERYGQSRASMARLLLLRALEQASRDGGAL